MTATKRQAASARPGSFIKLVRSINEPGGWIARLAWSPDGRELAVASQAEEITIIDTSKSAGDAARVRLRIPINAYHVYSVRWSPDGTTIASSQSESLMVHLWDTKSGRLVRTLHVFQPSAPSPEKNAPDVHAVAWSPSGMFLATGGDGGLAVWDVETWKMVQLFEEQPRLISAEWSPNGRMLAATGYDNILCIWDWGTKRLLHRIENYYGAGLAWSPDSTKVAAAGSARAVHVWDAATGSILNILEGHTDNIRGVDFSADGLLLATRAGRKSVAPSLGDPRTLLWRTDTWRIVGSIREVPDWYLYSGIKFSPNASLLALSAEHDKVVHIWKLNGQGLLDSSTRTKSVYYRNAKVALVGDSGVGKSGLAIVLTGNSFVPTESTHGKRVRVLRSQRVRVDQSHDEIREIVLWDLAGQPGYRLIHQLHLDDIGLALIVFDSRSELDPFSGVRHWNRAILQASRARTGEGRSISRLLVAARIDRGRVGVSRDRLASTLRELEITSYMETSAKEGTGVRELAEMVATSIAWDSLPIVTSNAFFQKVRSFLLKEKNSRRVLATVSELLRAFVRSEGKGSAKDGVADQFRACILQLQALGLIRALSFGDLVLLQPELIDAYASAMILV